jgi:RNA polymerase sigma-70 factor (ECF subfamily)
MNRRTDQAGAAATEGAADAAMARYAAGDDAAFAVVYGVVAPRLTGYLCQRMGDRSRLPDLVQETLLQVVRARSTFLPGAPVVPWLLAIARRQLVDAHRRSAREIPLDLDDQTVVSGLPTGEEIVAAKEMAGRLDGAMTRMSSPQRAAFELVKGQGLSLARAATTLGTSVTGVKLRTHRAYRLLRAELLDRAAA